MKRIIGAAIVAVLGLVVVACNPVPDPDGTHPASGLWLSVDELNALPAVPSYITSAANQTINNSDGAEVICSNDLNNSQHVLAAGIVAAKNNNNLVRAKVRDAIFDVIGSEHDCSDNRQLGIARKVSGYAWSADLINLKVFDPTVNQAFSNWLWTLVETNNGGDSFTGLAGCQLERTNNWGSVCGLARIVADSYMVFNDPDQSDRDRATADLTFRNDRVDANRVLQGQFDTSVYNGFGDRHANQIHACNPSTFATNGAPFNPGPPCDPPPSGGIDWNGGNPEDLDRGSRVPGTCSGTIDGHAFGAANYATGEVYAMWRYWMIKGDSAKANSIRSFGNKGGERVLGFFNRLRSSCGAAGNYPIDDDSPWPFLVNKLYGQIYPQSNPEKEGKAYSYTDYIPPLPQS